MSTGADGPRTPSGRLGVTAVVCAYNDDRWPLTMGAVRSLQAQTLPPAEIVLVVDHNGPLLERARAALPGVVVLPNREARGLSGARNTGVSVAGGDIVAFLDDDAEAEADWLERMVQHYDVPEVLGVGGFVEARWVAGRPAWYPAEFEWVVGCSYLGQPTSVAEVRNPIGAAMSFRRSVFEAVGGFEGTVGRVGSTPVGCEETELAIRARRRWPGSKIVFDPAARVRHTVPPERATVHYLLSRCWSEGISKAVVARIAGADAALASERSYVRRTLPRGIVRELSGLRGPRDAHRLGSAAAMCVGLASAAAGFTTRRLRPYRPPLIEESP